MKLLGLFGRPPSSEEETDSLIGEVRALRSRSSIGSDGGQRALAIDIMETAGREHDATLGMRIGVPVYNFIQALIALEPIAYDPPDGQEVRQWGLHDQVELRDHLRAAKGALARGDAFMSTWRESVTSMLSAFYDEFPPQVFVDPDADGNFEEASALAPSAPLYTFVEDLPRLLERVVNSMLSHEFRVEGMFKILREKFIVRLCLASGIRPEDRYTTKKEHVMPTDKKGATDAELVELYLGDSPFFNLLTTPVPLHIPEAVRFEHTHILAGTGHGKTQALQYLIAADLERALKEKRSVVVMDSQGDLLQTLMHSPYFRAGALAERFVYIDPTDLERPVGLNLFDIGLDGLKQVKPVERETILNGTISFYEYFFGGLLGAELTQKQGVIFRYIATLMTRIPDANIQTLLALMEDGEKFRPFMRTLEGSARVFFETRFFDRTFSETKKQILTRLWGVLSSTSLDRMMSAKRNSVDLFNALQAGSVVFINTAADFLGHEGSAIFSRMFVALLGQALLRRAAVPRHERTETFIYIDEAEEVVDLMLTRLLAQVRKYKGAITFAHQNLDQLEASIRAGVMANTSVKLAGGVSAKDAHSLAGDFRCEPEFLLGQRKGKQETHFACFARNVTEKAVTLAIPFGYVEGKGKLFESEYQALLERSRQRYGVPIQQEPAEPVVEAVPVPAPVPKPPTTQASPPVAPAPAPEAPVSPPAIEPATEPATPTAPSTPEIAITRAAPTPARERPQEMGGGGVKHKYLEHLIKELGEERGFRVTLEEPIHDGAGRVDAVLIRNEIKLAVEISVTTTRDHELGNIEKCLALPYTHVVMLTSHKRRQVSLQRFIGEALEEGDKKRVSFLLPEDLPGFLDGYPAPKVMTERTVKGYTVRSKVKDTDATEALARRRAIAAVVARSLGS